MSGDKYHFHSRFTLKSGSSHCVYIKKIKTNELPTKVVSRRTLFSLFIVFFCEFMDNLGVAVVDVLLPFFADKFNSSTLQLGLLYSAYAVMLGLSSMYMGRLSDKYGRRKLIIFSFCGTMIGLVLHGFVTNYYQLLFCRVISGAFGSSITVLLPYITDVIPEKKRPKYISLSSASSFVAFVIGPLVGSIFAQFGLRMPFFVCAAFSFVGLVSAILWLQESHPKFRKNNQSKYDSVTKDASDDESEKLNMGAQLTDIEQLIAIDEVTEDARKDNETNEAKKTPPVIWMVCAVYFLLGMSKSTFTFVLYLLEKYNLSKIDIGTVLFTSSGFTIFSIIFIFNILSKKYGVYVTCYIGLVICATSNLFCTLFNNIWVHFTFAVLGLNLGYGIMFPGIVSMAINFTTIENRGKIVGYVNFSYATAKIIGPLLMAVIFDINIRYPFFLASVSQLFGMSILFALMVKYVSVKVPVIH